jgi:hypothetical protein
MAEVTKALPFDEAVKEIISRLGCSETRARFIAAIERGDIGGDCVELNKGGRRITPKPKSKRVA